MPEPANSHGSQNLALTFGLHTKGMQSSLLYSIPVTSCLTGAAFHAAALRGNLIHFLIKLQLSQCNAPSAGGTAP